MSKSYNPLKMWGAWVGLLLPFLLLWLLIANFSKALGGEFISPFEMIRNAPLAAVAILGGGFLLGWGIHSLVRAVRK